MSNISFKIRYAIYELKKWVLHPIRSYEIYKECIKWLANSYFIVAGTNQVFKVIHNTEGVLLIENVFTKEVRYINIFKEKTNLYTHITEENAKMRIDNFNKTGSVFTFGDYMSELTF